MLVVVSRSAVNVELEPDEHHNANADHAADQKINVFQSIDSKEFYFLAFAASAFSRLVTSC